jgi:YidC/Oxa1 family membrane protein insertase
MKSNLNKTGPYFNGTIAFFLIFTFLFATGVFAQTEPVKEFKRGAVVQEDLDNDGLKDAEIDTDFLRIVISSKTGAPSVYYLKGSNFEENILPVSAIDLGAKIDEPFLKPFISELSDISFDAGYKIETEEEEPGYYVVKAIANISVAESGGQNISLVKRYIIGKRDYFFTVEHIITNLGDNKTFVGDESKGSLKFSYGPGLFMEPYGPITLLALETEDKMQSFKEHDKLNALGSVSGALNGVGIKDQYFCLLMENLGDENIRVNSNVFDAQFHRNTQTLKQRGAVLDCILPMFSLEAKDSKTFKFRVYAGPIILDELVKINRSSVSEYGFLSTILMRTLQFFYSLFPNYGLAIILLTIMVRIVLYPLTLKQTKSMAAMQKIAPKVQDLKDRYKENPQKLNEEILKLYQKNNVNPLGGCLPLLLQLPVLIALYNTIRIAVELRKTPFLWITDLSKGDPTLILPIAIAVLMYITQAKQPGVDPQQKQMFAMMPMFMFIITWTLPAGLLVYWFASSVLGILQQYQAKQIMANMKEE